MRRCSTNTVLPMRDRSFSRKAVNAASRLSKDFRLSIPEAIRDLQHWTAGDEFAFIPKAVGVLLLSVPTLDQLFGIAKGAKATGYRDREDGY